MRVHGQRLTAVLSVLCTVTQLTHVTARANHVDHGGVPMGHINVCDDAKTQITMDWDPSSTQEHTCDGDMISQFQPQMRSKVSCEEQTKSPIHVCYPHEIHYDSIPPTSGKHRPNWADYGEYKYVPPQRWLHDLEHGAIVMLYHPCADPREVDTLRTVVTGCIRKHIITPYKLLPRETPFALLSWGCKLMMSWVDPPVALRFIMDHAKRDGPEGQLARPGRYNQSIIVPAKIVSDYNDSHICPHGLGQVLGSAVPQSENPGMGALGYLADRPDLLRGASLLPDNPILRQSLRRRQQLDREAEELQRSYHSLQRVFQRLMDQ